jgi:FkbM family methyltransferase
MKQFLFDLLNTIAFIFRHPLVHGQRWSALKRWFAWQVTVRILKLPVIVPWVNGSSLIIKKGMAGATGNYYCGLHEFSDMGFLLHYLNAEDLFLDLGANVGSYTVLAAGVSKARVVSVEPITKTFKLLQDNIRLNTIESLVEIKNVGLGDRAGELNFSSDLDAENHVLVSTDTHQVAGVLVPVMRLDDLVSNQAPVMIKIDVEGYETAVLIGGERTFTMPSLQAVLIELNGAGLRYGFKDQDIRDKFRSWGFLACKYDPLTRLLSPVDDELASESGNTLFIRELVDVQKKLKLSKPFQVLGRAI